ncbi:MAG: acyl-CoA thioesterase [Syntrophobacteraceae bacterium]
MESHFRFFVPLQVRFVETDMQGHVFFGHYFTYFDLALTEYLKALRYTYDDFLKEGVDFFYVQTDCQFKGRAFFDEILHVHTRVGKIGNSSFTFEFSIFEETSGRPIATGHITAVAIDKETRETVRVPEQFRKAVADYEA